MCEQADSHVFISTHGYPHHPTKCDVDLHVLSLQDTVIQWSGGTCDQYKTKKCIKESMELCK